MAERIKATEHSGAIFKLCFFNPFVIYFNFLFKDS